VKKPPEKPVSMEAPWYVRHRKKLLVGGGVLVALGIATALLKPKE
jgi:hypothetical protein